MALFLQQGQHGAVSKDAEPVDCRVHAWSLIIEHHHLVKPIPASSSSRFLFCDSSFSFFFYLSRACLGLRTTTTLLLLGSIQARPNKPAAVYAATADRSPRPRRSRAQAAGRRWSTGVRLARRRTTIRGTWDSQTRNQGSLAPR